MSLLLTRREYLPGTSAAALALFHVAGAEAQQVGGAELAANRSRVIAACTRHWGNNQGDCSAFVRAVAQDVGIGLTGNANAIHKQISAAPWIRIGVGSKVSAVAGVTAAEGKLVVAARQAEPNGHVAIVVDYRNAFDSYSEADRRKAVAFWGNLNSVGAEYTRITKSWTAADLEQVLFAYRPL